jgi:RNA polymerase sigma-70 factor, ECF subfamily
LQSRCRSHNSQQRRFSAAETFSEAAETEQPELDEQERARLRSYADRFNARDFDALRELLAEDVKLDILLDWPDGQIRKIRDFRFAKYITHGLTVTRLQPGAAPARVRPASGSPVHAVAAKDRALLFHRPRI